MSMLWLVLACRPQEEIPGGGEPGCDDPGETEVAIFRTITFARRDGEGRSRGFDLDGLDSDASDPQGCFQADVQSPDGEPGIDSAFSALMPALDQTEAQGLEELMQDIINAGDALFALELRGVNDRQDDRCVQARMLQVAGPPMLGTDGLPEPGQTYDPDPDAPIIDLGQVEIAGGTLTAGPFDWAVPLDILGTHLDLLLDESRIRYTLAASDDQGGGQGYIGGGQDVAYTLDVITSSKSAVGEVINPVIAGLADLQPDASGACTQLSAVMEFTTTTGFFFEE